MFEETTRGGLSLPPTFRAVKADAVQGALKVATRLAVDGADPGTFVWAQREDAADCAIVLAPSEPLQTSLLVAYVTMVAVGDTLGALIPPVIPVGFGWPDRIVVNGAPAGGIRITAAKTESDGDVPDWMIASVTLGFKASAAQADPGRETHRTVLELEGCGELTVHEFLESYARHFLYWMNRWQDDGFTPVKLAWLERAAGYGDRNQGMETAGPWSSRKLLWMDETGGVQFVEDGKEKHHPLAELLGEPTWTV
jgi:BirA family biotin operon repressor/biotin-[acetyl-CoA-carboxylase] ligase